MQILILFEIIFLSQIVPSIVAIAPRNNKFLLVGLLQGLNLNNSENNFKRLN